MQIQIKTDWIFDIKIVPLDVSKRSHTGEYYKETVYQAVDNHGSYYMTGKVRRQFLSVDDWLKWFREQAIIYAKYMHNPVFRVTTPDGKLHEFGRKTEVDHEREDGA